VSGHEKFYIPHDDLVALKASIDTLDVSIGTLDTTIQDTLIARYELNVTDTHTVTDGNIEVLVRNAVLSATKDCFIRRVIAVVTHPTTDPLTNFDSDISVGVGVSGGTQAVAEQVFGDSNRCAMRTLLLADEYRFYRTWFVNDCKIPANTALLVDAYFCNIAVDTAFATVIIYVEDVYA